MKVTMDASAPKNKPKKILLALAVIGAGFMGGCLEQSPSDQGQSQKIVAQVEEGSVEESPNILFILTDDQTVNTINSLGNSAIQTPNLDRLAKKGTSFTHVYNQGSWSGAVCAASRRMINTGRHLFHTGLASTHDGSNQEQYPLMGEVLQENGYETFITGKWHIDTPTLRRSFSLGSAVHESGMSGVRSGGQFHPNVAEYDGDDSVQTKLPTQQANKHSSELFTDAAINYLENKSARNEKPFFMYVAYLAPHDPRQSPQEYVNMYPPENIELPANYKPEHPFDQGDHSLRDEALLPFPRTEEAVKNFIAEYYAMITHLDAQVGRLLEALDSSEYGDNTLVIFTSDHGLAVGQHGLLGKQSQYDHSVRAPFIVKGPGIPADKVSKGAFYLHSIFPTVLDYAGIDIPNTVETVSVMPLIRGEQDAVHETVYGAYKRYQRMLRDDQYKLIYYPMLKKSQLFDISNDPLEMNDLSENPAHAERLVAMHQLLEGWKQRVGDPLNNDDPVGSYSNYYTKSKVFKYPELADPH